MNRRDFLTLTAGFGAACALGRSAAAAPSRKPNILIFLADDLGWRDDAFLFLTPASLILFIMHT
jgi:hypothetical protein